jgi:2-polyprenyl-3-methyl-5-hydroxy-6-metoxy-1,4-benzoquinol methylase
MMERPADYYAQARSELLPLLEPFAGAVILDVGCGAGELGKLLKSRGAGPVHGIECIAGEATAAARIYDKVHACPAEQVDFSACQGFFDIIICADILEHLADPWDLLCRLRGTLKSTGFIVASIPNVRNRRVIGNLLAGKFEYLSAGILDKTHLRFFTFDSVVKLFADTGYRIESMGPVYSVDADTLLPQWKTTGMKEKLGEMVKQLTGNTQLFNDDDLMDLFTHQFLLKAKKS